MTVRTRHRYGYETKAAENAELGARHCVATVPHQHTGARNQNGARQVVCFKVLDGFGFTDFPGSGCFGGRKEALTGRLPHLPTECKIRISRVPRGIKRATTRLFFASFAVRVFRPAHRRTVETQPRNEN